MNVTSWSRRLAVLQTDGWELESGEARHAQNGDKFWIPSVGERHSLKVGQAAKLLFQIESEDEAGRVETTVERMWAVVSGRVGDLYIAILDSQPACIEPGYLDRGTEFVFKAEHVIDIDQPPREHLLSHYGDRLHLEAKANDDPE